MPEEEAFLNPTTTTMIYLHKTILNLRPNYLSHLKAQNALQNLILLNLGPAELLITLLSVEFGPRHEDGV